LKPSTSYFAAPNVNTQVGGVTQCTSHVSQHSWIEDSDFGTTQCGTQAVTLTTMEVVCMPNKTHVSRLVCTNASQSQQKLQLDPPNALLANELPTNGHNLTLKQLTKEQITCDELEGTRNISQEHISATLEFKRGKNGFKGKSTSNLWVPNKEDLF